MIKLILLTGRDCPLCEEAELLLDNLKGEHLSFVKTDVYSKREYLDKYWDKIPVILLEDKELFWPFSTESIQEFIS